MQRIKRNGFCAAAVAVGIVALAGNARADYTGVGWAVSNTSSENATIANAAAQAGNTNRVDFTVSALDFSSFGNIGNTGNGALDYTVGTFLNSLGSLVGSPTFSGTLTSGTSLSNGSTTGMLYEFTGTAFFTNGQSFTVNHDDGLEFQVNGVDVINDPGPTSPTTTTATYTGPTGNFSFVAVYGECCGAPAVFETTLVPATTPEPSSFVLFGAALLGVVTLRRRKISKLL
jgi:PEP-CTERM motif